MPPDQAAGLRRRRGGLLPRCLHVFFDAPESTHRLLAALQRIGLRTLLVDVQGRLLADSPARSLFDWRQQLVRGTLQPLPMPHGEGWHAPGVRADAPGLAEIAQGYDLLVFDEGLGVRIPGGARSVVVEVAAGEASLQRVYAFLKTLFHRGSAPGVVLLGAPDACDRVRAACARFLDPRFAEGIVSARHEDDAFVALAVRMADEETGRAPVQ